METYLEHLVDPETGRPRVDAVALDDFAVLGLPRTLDLDLSDVESAAFKLAAAVHPDRFARADETERAVAEALYRRVREAAERLADKFLRAEALLAAAGGKRADQDRTTPADFLGEMLELHEQLQDADETVKRGISIELEEKENALFSELRVIFEHLEERQARDHARVLLNQLAYIRKTRKDFYSR